MLNLVPYPQQCRIQRGEYTLIKKAQARVADPARLPLCIRHKLTTLGLRLKADASLPALTCAIGMPDLEGVRAPHKAEGYALHVMPRGIVVRGYDADGLFWGLITLEQLLNGGRMTPCVEIRDWPAFGFRGHHDDISRKQVSTVADFKRIIRLLSSYKIKYYTPYMEDMLFLKSYPDIGATRGHLLPHEVKAIVEEGARHNVVVFPTYSLIGHQENLLSMPRYRKLARDVFYAPSSLDPSKPAVRPFLRKVIRDVCELFPDAPFFHACFDETQGLTCEQLISHANWCAEELRKHGKKMLMWVDMFKNHHGLDKLRLLSDNIIPVEWHYLDPTVVEGEYKRHGLKPCGLAGYNNWGVFLPDFRLGKRNMDAWAGMMRRLGGPGFATSLWGDNGCENSRDLCWNLYAYNAEAAWNGKKTHGLDFERRFHISFYGAPLPTLLRMKDKLMPQRRIDPRRLWRLFRYSIQALVRLTVAEPTLATVAQRDLRLQRAMLRAVNLARPQARREQQHLDHFIVALERERLVCERIVLAHRIARRLSGARLRAAVQAHLRDTAGVRALYQKIWLRHNKRPNIEVSLAVYDAVADSLRALLAEPPTPKENYQSLPLGPAYDSFFADVAGLPLAPTVVNDVPFTFAGKQHTHVALTGQRSLTVCFPRTNVKDIHLLYGGMRIPMDLTNTPPLLEVQLKCGNTVVFHEQLQAVRHICDWFAPRGEHIWAGGGLQHTDPRRVRYGFQPGQCMGVLHLSGFAPRGVAADTLVLRALAKDERCGVALFAATLQT